MNLVQFGAKDICISFGQESGHVRGSSGNPQEPGLVSDHRVRDDAMPDHSRQPSRWVEDMRADLEFAEEVTSYRVNASKVATVVFTAICVLAALCHGSRFLLSIAWGLSFQSFLCVLNQLVENQSYSLLKFRTHHQPYSTLAWCFEAETSFANSRGGRPAFWSVLRLPTVSFAANLGLAVLCYTTTLAVVVGGVSADFPELARWGLEVLVIVVLALQACILVVTKSRFAADLGRHYNQGLDDLYLLVQQAENEKSYNLGDSEPKNEAVV